MAVYKITISSASDNVALWTQIPVSPGEGPNGTTMCGDQVADISAVSTATGAAATLAFAWVNGDIGTANQDGVTKYVTASVTPGSRQSKYDNTGTAGYICAVAFADNTSKLDLIGTGRVNDGVASNATRNPRTLRMGITAMGGLTSVDVYVTTTRIL